MICMLHELKSVVVQEIKGALYVSIPKSVAKNLNLKKGDSLIPIAHEGKLVYVTPDKLKEVI